MGFIAMEAAIFLGHGAPSLFSSTTMVAFALPTSPAQLGARWIRCPPMQRSCPSPSIHVTVGAIRQTRTGAANVSHRARLNEAMDPSSRRSINSRSGRVRNPKSIADKPSAPRGNGAQGPRENHERVHKALARAGVCSRRAAEKLIEEGRVSVNGTVVSAPGPCIVDTYSDIVEIDGRCVSFRKPPPVWFAINKPKGYISTVYDDRGRRTVMDLVRDSRKNSLVPVGRLDSHSTGLLILTNERDQVHELTHPSSMHVKVYIAHCTGRFSDEALNKLRNGILLEGDSRPTLPADVDVLEVSYAKPGSSEIVTVLEFRIREGRNRQIRRMCDAVNHPVRTLKRIAFGPVRLDSRMRLGESRYLTANEVKALKRGVGVSAEKFRRKQ